ncbi:MAG: hypothetical protein HKN39_08315 [Flavobacteriales bacterium]|nr:hypothetical protein [Flavobacteriales bacterium]
MKTRIEKYISSELSGSERNALEKEALDDPFLADAIEGFEFAGNSSLVEHTRNSFDQKFSSGGSSWVLKGIIGTAIVVAFAGAFFLLSEKEERITEQSNSAVTLEEKTPEGPSGRESTALPGIEEIDAEEKQIEVSTDGKVLIIEEESVPENKFELNEDLTPIKTIGNEQLIDPSYTSRIDTKLRRVRGSNMELDYFYHMKVVDYSEVGRKAIKVNKTLEHGTPAYMENQDTDNGVSINFDKENWVPYMEYLEGCLKHVSKGRNKLALINFDVIFEHYPDDANAQFYSGLCNFYLKRYEEAIIHLDAVAENKTNTFHEEADWHKLLCYKAIGEREKFEELKKEIVDLGGFYAERATGLTFK